MSLFPFATEHLLAENDAKSLTEPYWPQMSQVWLSAQTTYGELSETHRARLGQTAIVPPLVAFGFAQSFAREAFDGRESEGLVPCQALGVFGFYIGDRLLIKFNVVDQRSFVVRNTESRG